MNKSVRQFVLPVLSAAIWGAAFLAQGNLSNVLPPFFINFARSMLAVITLSVVDVCFTSVKKAQKKETKPINKKMFIIGGTCCGLSLCVAVNLQQLGIDYGATAGEAAFITTLYMVLVPIFGVILKRKIGLNVWISVVFAVIGLAFICEIHTLNFSIAYLYLILAALFFAMQIMFVDYFVGYVDGIKLSCVQFLITGVLSGVISLCVEKVDTTAFKEAIFPLLYLGVCSSAIGYTLQITAQKGTNPAVVSLLLSFESAFALLFDVVACLFTGNKINETPMQFLGCFLMFTAIVLCQINSFKRKKKKKEADNRP